MITESYTIRFNFRLEATPLNITLEAQAQEHHSQIHYIVKNFRIPSMGDREVLPPISIYKKGITWVHTDSGNPSELSKAVGAAIETRPISS